MNPKPLPVGFSFFFWFRAPLTWFLQGQIGQRVNLIGGRRRRFERHRRRLGRRRKVRRVDQGQTDGRPMRVLRRRDARLAVNDRRVPAPARRLYHRTPFTRFHPFGIDCSSFNAILYDSL